MWKDYMVRVLFILLGTLFSSSAWSCQEPILPAPETTFDQATLLFHGRISKIESIEATGKWAEEYAKHPVAKDMPRLPSGFLKIYAEPLHIIKGEPSLDKPIVTYAAGFVACNGIPMFAGFEYLFVVRPFEDFDELSGYLADLPADSAGFIDPSTQMFEADPSVSERFEKLIKLSAKNKKSAN